MTEFVNLIGAEDVQRAGRDMIHAADSLRQTQGYLDETLRSFLTSLEELLERFKGDLESKP